VGFTWPSGAGRSLLRNRRNRRRPRRGRSGSLVTFPPPPWRCASPRPPSRCSDGTAPSHHHLAVAAIRADPRGLGSPSELSPAARVGLSSTSSRGIRRCWPRRTPAFAAVPRRAPLPPPPTPPPKRWVTTTRASTPAGVAACFGHQRDHLWQSRSVLVVSHHLDGFLRSEVAGLLHPAAGHGVRCVCGHSDPEPTTGEPIAVGGGMASSQRVSHPSKESSPAAAPRHRGRCPLAVGTARARPSGAHRCR
jgi:hypothetical protein